MLFATDQRAGAAAAGGQARSAPAAGLAKLDRFECLILDDIGYVQHDRDEMEVLFTLLAERYERRSVVITTNLVFSEWERIFKDPMTTLAAIDRVVHHSVVLDLMSGRKLPRQSGRSEIENTRRNGTSGRCKGRQF